MSKIIIRFEAAPIMEPQPWPVLVVDGVVQSGLGNDDGAHLIGFGPRGAQDVTVFRKQAEEDPTLVAGLVPTFGKDDTLFSWDVVVAELTVTTRKEGSSS